MQTPIGLGPERAMDAGMLLPAQQRLRMTTMTQSATTSAPVASEEAHSPTAQAAKSRVKAPRRIRLSRILIEMRREAKIVEAGDTPDSEPKPKRQHRRKKVRTNITVGEIMDRSAHAGFGFVFALMAVASIPLPGISVPFGLAISMGAVQMILGGNKPWLPRMIREHNITMRTLTWISVHLARWTRGLERWVRPRFEFMCWGPLWSLCGAGVLVLGVGLSLPLPIPFSNLLFIGPLLIYAIGLLENDGILVALGHASVGLVLAGAVLYGHLVVEAVTRVWAFLTGWMS